ncbi:MAG: helix-turn-helix domain-containing protein [Paracoccaceae bacterium]
MSVRSNLSALNCSLAKSLDIVGDGWTLLIIRDLFLGATRFSEISQSLGIAKNILSERLGTLCEAKIVERGGTNTRPHYRLSEKGLELVPPLLGLLLWGDKYCADGKAPIIFETKNENRLEELRLIDETGQTMLLLDLHAKSGEGAEFLTKIYLDRLTEKKNQ